MQKGMKVCAIVIKEAKIKILKRSWLCFMSAPFFCTRKAFYMEPHGLMIQPGIKIIILVICEATRSFGIKMPNEIKNLLHSKMRSTFTGNTNVT
jgi:hypothetical protein